jgi:hypothetical protein
MNYLISREASKIIPDSEICHIKIEHIRAKISPEYTRTKKVKIKNPNYKTQFEALLKGSGLKKGKMNQQVLESRLHQIGCILPLKKIMIERTSFYYPKKKGNNQDIKKAISDKLIALGVLSKTVVESKMFSYDISDAVAVAYY